MTKKISYEKSGVKYESLDPAKKNAQVVAKKTAKFLKKAGFSEISGIRGESAFVWDQGNVLMASVIEGLGTKNLVADEMANIFPHSRYYHAIGHDTVATVINDLITVGARPLVIHAYWAVSDGKWFENKQRTKDLISGWESACNSALVTWGGGETPALKNLIEPNVIELGGAAIGIIKDKNNLITDEKIRSGDRIILIKSNGINCNGLSLTREIAKKLPKSFATKITNHLTFGDALLTETNIYSNLIQDLQKDGIDIHYISNITGHGLRKVMRAKGNFKYIIENIFEPQEVFNFIQKQSNLSDYEMYQTFNMGQDYAIFVSPKDVKKTQAIIKKNKFESLDAGYVQKGPRQVIIEPKNITFTSKTLNLR